MSETFILSHKNPDTDSIAASIVAEEYFNEVVKTKSKAYRVGELNNETKFVLGRFGVNAPEKINTVPEDAKLILIDHNNPLEAVDNLDPSQVEAIIDHHKLTLQTEKPIFCLIEPLGSTCAVLAKLYFQAGKEITLKIANLIIAGILSDTLNLTGPTTTKEDRKIIKDLNKIAKIDTEGFSQKMFEAKSDISGLSAKDIIVKDSKLFQMGSKKVFIGGWETLKPDLVLKLKEQIISELRSKKSVDIFDYAFFLLVDILKGDSILFIIGEEEKLLAEKVFKVKAQNDFVPLKGVVSRKKQIVPPLMAELAK